MNSNRKNFTLIILIISSSLHACTGIRLKAKDGTVVYARTLEFSQPLNSEILFIPRGYVFVGETPYKQIPGLQWKSTYAVLGANALQVTAFVDGVNEKGLAGGIFYFPEYAHYSEVTPKQAVYSLASWQLLTWILTTCATLEQVKEQLPQLYISTAAINGTIQPVHYIIHDQQGKSLVIEYTKNGLHFYDNELGVITNSPSFDWHITNLRNYINLSAVNVPKVTLSDISLIPFGQGSGMLGLPGDFTPPSRFVRATAFGQAAFTPDNGNDAVHTVFHVLNLFDIPKGVVRSRNHTFNSTQWTSAINLQTKCYFFHTYNNRQIYTVDLNKLENNKEKLTIAMQQKPAIIDLTPSNQIEDIAAEDNDDNAA